MKKWGVLILVILISTFLCGADMSEADRFSENEYGINFSETAEKVSKGGNPFDIEQIFLKITDGFTKEVKTAFLSVSGVLGVLFLYSVAGAMQEGFGGKGVYEISFLVVYSLVCTALLGGFSVISQTVTDLIDNVVLFSNAAIPLIGTSVAASGNFAIYSAMHPLLIGIAAISANIIKSIGVPALTVSLSFSVIGNISGGFSLSEIGKTIRNSALWLICGLLTLFSAAVAVCGISAPGINGIVLKGAKFVVRSAVPVLGGLLSDSAEAVMMGGMMLKNAMGTAAVIVVSAMLLYPLIKVMSAVLVYKLTAAFISPFCDKRISSVISDIAGVLSCLSAFAVAECVTVIVSLTSLLGASNAGVMLR